MCKSRRNHSNYVGPFYSFCNVSGGKSNFPEAFNKTFGQKYSALSIYDVYSFLHNVIQPDFITHESKVSRKRLTSVAAPHDSPNVLFSVQANPSQVCNLTTCPTFILLL